MAGIGGGIYGKRLCSLDHRVPVGAERVRRFCEERTKGVLWRHASVNLVKPRADPGRGVETRQGPGTQ
ncbi:hypothetical protein GCM10023325_21060 [Sphingomonas lutea]